MAPSPDSPDDQATDYTRLISLAVHEMRTPASVMGGYLRMLQTDAGALGERQKRMISEAEKSCARLVSLLAELSDLGKLDAGTAAVKNEKFDFFALISEVAADVPPIPDREVHLETRGLDSIASITGDRARLRAALDVVIRAVMREQPSDTRVVAEARRVTLRGQTAARLVVAPEPDLVRATGALPVVLDDYRGGLGLGLPIARRVIARHGGSIWSTVPENGAELPLGSRGAIVLSVPLSDEAR